MGVSRFCVQNLLSRSAENFRRESFTVALLSSIEKVWIRGGGGGVSRFSVENFLSPSAENFRGESFTVALISGAGKVWVRRGEYHDFPSKLFCLTIPKNFGGEPSGVSENFWYRNFLCFRGLCHDFRFSVKIFFVSQCRNFSQMSRSVLCFRSLPVSKKFR